jgi:hypothetical protein
MKKNRFFFVNFFESKLEKIIIFQHLRVKKYVTKHIKYEKTRLTVASSVICC